jgi:hypothetical protein
MLILCPVVFVSAHEHFTMRHLCLNKISDMTAFISFLLDFFSPLPVTPTFSLSTL